MYGLHGVFAVEVGADHVGVFLVEDGASYHDAAVGLFLAELADGFFHADYGGGHECA